MEAAGARIIRGAVDDAVVGLPGLKKINEHLSFNRKIGRWLTKHHIDVHIPVDSPAANFPICKLTKAHGIKVVHLVAPQLWAWGGWRIRKLRRLTDHVLCLLPFEETWFRSRGVAATFVGHPIFDEGPDLADPERVRERFPSGEPRLAIMPGSRPAEISNNFPLLLETFRALKRERPQMSGVVAATTPAVAERLREMAASRDGWPDDLEIAVGRTDLVIDWADAALAVSGTVLLQIARQRKPMVAFYRTNRFFYQLIGRWLIETKSFALPNVIARRRIIPELIPFFGKPAELARTMDRLLSSESELAAQRRALEDLVGEFEGRTAASASADMIESIAAIEPPAYQTEAGARTNGQAARAL